MAKYKVMVLAWQVGLFRLTLTQIKSEMNCIAKNKCPDSQKLDLQFAEEFLVSTVVHVQYQL